MATRGGFADIESIAVAFGEPPMASSGPPSPDALLADLAWLERLALRLVGDAALAEDLSQSTWARLLASARARALEGPSRRSWLATVLRRTWVQELRGRARRPEREAVAARPEADPEAAQLVERAELLQRVLARVLELDEPYRRTVLMRFHEGLPPRRIARRLGLPVGTVKTRLHRALARLRVALEPLDEDARRAWIGLFASAGSGRLLTLGALSMKLRLAALAVALALAVGLSLDRGGEPAAPGPPAGEDPPAPVEPHPAAVADTTPAIGGKRVPLPTEPDIPEVGPPSETEASGAAAQLFGRVVDLDERPVAGLEVELVAAGVPDARATTDGAGGFALPRPGGPASVRAHSTRFSTVLAASFRDADQLRSEPVIVVAPTVHPEVLVRDAGGAPVADARVDLYPDANLRARFGLVLDGSADQPFQRRTDAEGRIASWTLPALPEAFFLVAEPGYLPTRVPFDPALPSILVVLERPEAQAGVLLGRVDDPAGRPVPAARIALGPLETLSDELGLFAVPLEGSYDARRLVAMKAGHQGVTRTLGEAELQAAREGRGDVIRVTLGPEPLSIQGRVVDAEGEPRAGIKVWTQDVTVFGRHALALETYQWTGAAGWTYDVSDDQGRFEVGGLVARDYLLSAQDSTTQLQVQAGPFAAGTRDAGIELPADGVLAVRGRVRSAAGTGLAGVRVQATRGVLALDRDTHGVTSYADDDGPTAVTDERGNFTFEALGRDGVTLAVFSDRTMPAWFELDGLGRVTPAGRVDVALVVERRLHLQVELADPAAADGFRVLDAAGEILTLSVFKGRTRDTTRRGRLYEGRSSVLAVSDRAAELVVFLGDVEVTRQALGLVPDRVNTVRVP